MGQFFILLNCHPEHVINNYCYITGTFTVPRHYVYHEAHIGFNISQTGVGPYDPRSGEEEVKAYYQWVPFMLFLQSIMFYLPHIIYKSFEGGKIKVRKKRNLRRRRRKPTSPRNICASQTVDSNLLCSTCMC